MERKKFWEFKRRSRRDEPFLINDRCQVEVQWCMQLRHPNRPLDLNLVPTWSDQFDQALVIHFHCSTLWQHEKTQNSAPSLYLSKGWKGRGFWCPLQSRIRASQWVANMFAFISCLSSFTVRYSGVLGVEEPHQSIPNLVVKLYCGDDTVGEVLQKNSSAPGW